MKIPDMMIGLDPKITATRLNFCQAVDCQFNNLGSIDCQFKEVEIGAGGQCLQYRRVPV